MVGITIYEGIQQSDATMLGGNNYVLRLSNDASMTVMGGVVGLDDIELHDDAHLIIDGGSAFGLYGMYVMGRSVLDFHSGSPWPAQYPSPEVDPTFILRHQDDPALRHRLPRRRQRDGTG